MSSKKSNEEKSKKRVWLRKWDYTKYPFDRLISDYKNDDIKELGVNYGLKFDKEEDLKDGSLIQPGDDIYIYFKNIPGLDNQIMLKYEDVQTTDEEGKLLFAPIKLGKMKDSDVRLQKYCTVKTKNKIKWVIDKNNRFTKEGLINEFNINDNFYTSLDITDKALGKALEKLEDDGCLASISKYSEKYKNICNCFFIENKLTGLLKRNHDTFIKKDGLPYIERHHFIPQEVYNNAPDEIKGKLYNKIYSRDNILFLCPRCHRMIHLGEDNLQDEMLKIIMKQKNIKKNVEDIANILDMTSSELLTMCYKEN